MNNILTVRENKRESNLELLRIVSMILIILHHCVIHGGSYIHSEGFNRTFSYILIPGGKIGFDAFLALSTWFLAGKDFKGTRFLKVFFEVLLYSVVFTAAAVVFGEGTLEFRYWISVFLPIAGNVHGFAATYLAFYLLTPFLNKIAQSIAKKQLIALVVVLSYVQVFSLLIAQYTEYSQPFRSEITLFVLFYFISLYLKRYPAKITRNRKCTAAVSLVAVVFAWSFTVLMWKLCEKTPTNKWYSFLFTLCLDESSVIYIAGGYALFYLFKSFKIPHSRIINYIAGTTFGVLLIHDHNFFRYCLWNNIIKTYTWYNSVRFVGLVFLVSFGVFICCALIDVIRKEILERNFFKLPFIKKLSLLFDDIFNPKEKNEDIKE